MSTQQWLQSSLQPPHLAFSVRTLDSRESQRNFARTHPHSSLDRHNLQDYYSCSVGKQSANKRANRYIALEPYDRTRVLVPGSRDVRESGDDTSESRYLNANWVREMAGGKWWIAGQAPLPNTAHAFLTLAMCPVAPPRRVSHAPSVPARRVHTIVQLTLMFESGRRRAHPYFPGAPAHQHMVIVPETGCDAPPIHVHVDSEEEIENAQCVKTELRLRWGASQTGRHSPEEWKVTHLLYCAWPDFGVPKENHSILKFARLVEHVNNCNLTQPAGDPIVSPPILVHCSAGVGRTGSFIALTSLLRAYSLLSSPRTASPSHLTPSLALPLPVSPLGPLPEKLGDDLVAREIDALREQRQSMVQRGEQVVWVYRALSDALAGM